MNKSPEERLVEILEALVVNSSLPRSLRNNSMFMLCIFGVPAITSWALGLDATAASRIGLGGLACGLGAVMMVWACLTLIVNDLTAKLKPHK